MYSGWPDALWVRRQDSPLADLATTTTAVPVPPAMYSHAADEVSAAPGIPCPSRSEASASKCWAPPLGDSRSACSTDSVQVTAAADRSPMPTSAS